jgi:hypothetical protein
VENNILNSSKSNPFSVTFADCPMLFYPMIGMRIGKAARPLIKA